MRKWNIPLTYAPKIAGVLDGSIRQTIRVGRKFRVGDLVSFHGWEGRPYRSKWSFRTPYFELLTVDDIGIFPDTGIVVFQPQGGRAVYSWGSMIADIIAEQDGIEPPTGEALCRVLSGMHKIPEGGVEAQIIRW